jgi:hypothetical protein
MKLSTLIKRLEAVKAKEGDIHVEARNLDGEALTHIRTRVNLTYVRGMEKKDFPRTLLIES